MRGEARTHDIRNGIRDFVISSCSQHKKKEMQKNRAARQKRHRQQRNPTQPGSAPSNTLSRRHPIRGAQIPPDQRAAAVDVPPQLPAEEVHLFLELCRHCRQPLVLLSAVVDFFFQALSYRGQLSAGLSRGQGVPFTECSNALLPPWARSWVLCMAIAAATAAAATTADRRGPRCCRAGLRR